MKRILAILAATLASIGLAYANPTAPNLAGEKLAQKEAAPAKDAKKADAKKADAKKADAKKADEKADAGNLIDINTASEQELDALPGIGEARAKAIIKGRPYKGKDDLVRKKVIPKSEYDKIKDKIIAKQK
ncbi:MAG TPA: helix-hairpin-helix domain-containing protein [Usitatibacter sp.]|nr:helix-hairpin-helix domain-containing protein [Usitatibacter sp.]